MWGRPAGSAGAHGGTCKSPAGAPRAALWRIVRMRSWTGDPPRYSMGGKSAKETRAWFRMGPGGSPPGSSRGGGGRSGYT